MDKLEKSPKLLRHELNSIDLSDILELLDEKISDANVIEVANAADVFYTNYFKRRLKLLIQKQLEYGMSYPADEEKRHFAAGTINGLALVNDWFKDQCKISRNGMEKPAIEHKEEPFDTVGMFNK